MRKICEAYILTILEIMEDRPTFTLSRGLYCLLIGILFLQITGYFFSTYESKPLKEEKIDMIVHYVEVSPGTFFLYVKGDDQLTLIGFGLMQIMLYGYFLYVGGLTLRKKSLKVTNKLNEYVKQTNERNQQNYTNFKIKRDKRRDLEQKEVQHTQHQKKYQKSKIIQNINQVLNIFFTFFWWIFLTPFLEINSGIYACGQNSFLTVYRGSDDCSSKPIILKIFSIIGLIFTLIGSIIIVSLFRSYEFHDPNLLKRKFQYKIFLQIPFHFLIILFFYLNLPSALKVKHLLASSIGITFIYDALTSWPFHDRFILIFYGFCTVAFEVTVILSHLWMFTDLPIAQLFFYLLLLISIPAGGFMTSCINYKYEKLMRITQRKFEKMYHEIDFYLEELIKLLLESRKDEQSGFKLSEIIIYHKQECTYQLCYCHSEQFQFLHKDYDEQTQTEKNSMICKKEEFNNLKELKKTQINDFFEDIFKLVDSIFKWSLKQPKLLKNQLEYEHLSLKYITYLIKYRQNATKAFYELKCLLQGRKKKSLYFKMISKILSCSIEKIMEQNEKMSLTLAKQQKEKLAVWVVFKMERFKDQFVSAMTKALLEKSHFWNELLLGDKMVDKRIEFCLKQANNISQLNQAFQYEFNQLDYLSKKTAMAFKLKSIFEFVIKGKILESAKLSSEANDLQKRDNNISSNSLNNSTIFKRQTASLIVSFVKSPGKILNKLPSCIKKLFNFPKDDVESILNIDQLMPQMISNIHHQLMKNVNDKGAHSPFVGVQLSSQKNILSFCIDNKGFIFPVKIQIGHCFGYFDDFCFAGSILKQINNYEYILFDTSGKIQGISEIIFSKIFQSQHGKYHIDITNVKRLCYIFLLFSDILNTASRELDEKLRDSDYAFKVKKATINLTFDFLQIMQSFEVFLLQNRAVPDMLTESGRNLMKKFINQKSRNNICQFKNDLPQWIEFQYYLNFQEVKYEQGSKKLSYFSLQLFDIQESIGLNENHDSKEKLNLTKQSENFTGSQDSENFTTFIQREQDFGMKFKKDGKVFQKIKSQKLNVASSYLNISEIQDQKKQNSANTKQNVPQLQPSGENSPSSQQKDNQNKSIVKSQGRDVNKGLSNHLNNLDDEGQTTKRVSNSCYLEREETQQFENSPLTNCLKNVHSFDKFQSNLKKEKQENNCFISPSNISLPTPPFLCQKEQIPSEEIFQIEFLSNDIQFQASQNIISTNLSLKKLALIEEDQQIKTEIDYSQKQKYLNYQENLLESLKNHNNGNQLGINSKDIQINEVNNEKLKSTMTDTQEGLNNQKFILNTSMIKNTENPLYGEMINPKSFCSDNQLINQQESGKQLRCQSTLRCKNIISEQQFEVKKLKQPKQDIGNKNSSHQKKEKIIKNKISARRDEDANSYSSNFFNYGKLGSNLVLQILDKNKLPRAAKGYQSVLIAFVLLLIFKIAFSSKFKSLQINQMQKTLNNYSPISDLESNFQRALSAGIRYQSSMHFSSFNSTESYIEQKFAISDLQASLQFNNLKEKLYYSIKYNKSNMEVMLFNQFGKNQTLYNQNSFSLLEFLGYKIQELSNSTPNHPIFTSSMLTLIYNQQNFASTISNIKLNDENEMNSYLDNMNFQSYIETIIYLTLCLGISISVYPLNKEMAAYKERIILLVARMSIEDISQEIRKYEYLITSLNDVDECFLFLDFISLNQEKQKIHSSDYKKLPRKSGISAFEDTTFTHKNQTQQLKKTSNIISEIPDSKVRVFSFCSSIGLACFFSAIYFSLIMILSLFSNPEIISSFDLTLQSLKARSLLGNFNVNTELLAVLNKISEQDSIVPKMTTENRQKLSELSNQQMLDLQSNQDFMLSNLYTSSLSSSLVESYLLIMKQLLSNNICQVFESCSSDKFPSCKQLPLNCNDFNKGISGILASYVSQYYSYESIYLPQFPSTSTVLEFIHSSSFISIIAQGFQTPDMAFRLFSQVSQESTKQLINNLYYLLQLINGIAGPILILISAYSLFIHWKKLKSSLLTLNYLLLCIPQEKLSQEITIYVLKVIKKS